MMRAARVKSSVVAVLGALSMGFEYDPLPGDNLVENPWFRVDCAASLDGWSVDVTPDGLSWGQSDKTQNPSDENCEGDYTGYAARWAKQVGMTPELSPNQDARLWQVVGPVSTEDTTLRFHFLFVAHRMTRLRAQISGGPSADGPWTPLWTPLDASWLTPGGANAPFEGTCPGGLQDRDCLWDKVTEAELGSLEPLSFAVSAGHPYYRIEFLGNYPDPDSTATGDVGAKIARVYFALGEGPPAGGGAGGQGGAAAPAATTGAGGASEGIDPVGDDGGDGCACRSSQGSPAPASSGLALLFGALGVARFGARRAGRPRG